MECTPDPRYKGGVSPEFSSKKKEKSKSSKKDKKGKKKSTFSKSKTV